MREYILTLRDLCLDWLDFLLRLIYLGKSKYKVGDIVLVSSYCISGYTAIVLKYYGPLSKLYKVQIILDRKAGLRFTVEEKDLKKTGSISIEEMLTHDDEDVREAAMEEVEQLK